jgi:hypothetical protein
MAKVQPLLTAGIARRQATEANSSGLGSLDVRITNPPDATLDFAFGNTISLDSNVTGWSWFAGRSWRRAPAERRRSGCTSSSTSRS